MNSQTHDTMLVWHYKKIGFKVSFSVMTLLLLFKEQLYNLMRAVYSH